MDKLEKTSEYLKVIAHPVRLRIIQILRNNRFSVGELARVCETSGTMISGHLGKLKARGILKKQRQGRKVFYQVVEPVYRDIMACLAP
jgi:ArsR family transcriptional regulator